MTEAHHKVSRPAIVLASSEYHRGIQLFNGQNFFEAHEVWEDVWREAEGVDKKFLQGLIQVAVAFHHHSTGNLAGARSLLGRGRGNLVLVHYPEERAGIKVGALLESLANWHAALWSSAPEPVFPKIERTE